jgi:hypothetical protein
MEKQIAFLIVLLITLSVFAYSVYRYVQFFKLTRPKKIGDWGKRIKMTVRLLFCKKRFYDDVG